jgi:deazaflavin-dependent oxidoreductase (nitroreductase family)
MTPRQKPRGRPYNRPIVAAQRFATRLHSSVYRATGGKVGGRLLGSPVLLLTTTGRKSGRPRTIPLLYLPDGENLVVVASNGGTAGDPAWWLNLEDDPEANVEVGGRKLRVRAEEAEGEERRRLWEQLVRMYSAYQQYQERTDRRIHVVVLYPVE